MTRINIIGAGLAGLSAAITLAEMGIPCNLISAQPSERAQSVLAEGGINAALDTMGEADSPEQHAADTLKAGVFLADPEAVRDLANNAPEIVEWLVRLGAPLERKDGRLIQRNFGGQKKKRTAYAKSSTGKVLMTALIDECRKYEVKDLVHRFPHHELDSLCLRDGSCEGAYIRPDSFSNETLPLPGPVILAMGGLNGFFPGMTTGTTTNTGDAAAELFAEGVAFANLEFIQYHPTTVQISEKRMLISEAARGEGGRLYILRNGKPWYFMEEKYPELGNLMPRDVVSREMVMVCQQPDCEPRVYLDLTGLRREIWHEKLSDLREEIQHYLAIDPAKTPVPVSPGIHYFMGGIYVDRTHHTNFPGLYAAGECACQYHGANRLGGNSTLGALYGGRAAAETAARELTDIRMELPKNENLCGKSTASFDSKLSDILLSALGILRTEEHLRDALDRLEELPVQNGCEEKRRQLGKAMLLAAQSRHESRGAHSRTDYPERDDHFQKTSVLRFVDRNIQLSYEPVGKEFSA